MAEWLTTRVLRLVRVPEEPEPPPGDPSTLRVFRAAPGYFRLKLVRWLLAQLGALIGLIAGLVFLGRVDWFNTGWIGTGVTALEILAWAGFVAQLPVGLAALRLDYELRWYMLSDRALRIREGVLSVRERTMTFANIQQISVRQGPLEQMLGIADIEVSTAGGGGSSDDDGSDDLHRGYLRGVTGAESIRDAIRDRVREYRDSGLGDPGEAALLPAARTPGGPVVSESEPVAAVRELLQEARALRSVLG